MLACMHTASLVLLLVLLPLASSLFLPRQQELFRQDVVVVVFVCLSCLVFLFDAKALLLLLFVSLAAFA
jgi:hypothetical protein